jgi:hypothetical protein
MAIMQNRSLGHAVTIDTANNTYNPSDFAVPNSSIETVNTLGITKIIWTGDWVIKRGGVVVWQTANNTGFFDLNKAGISITVGNTAANIQINTTSSSATLILGVSKQSSTTANTW